MPWFHVPRTFDEKMNDFPVIYDLDNPRGGIFGEVINRLEQLSNRHICHVPWFHVPRCSDEKMNIFPVIYDLDNPCGEIFNAI